MIAYTTELKCPYCNEDIKRFTTRIPYLTKNYCKKCGKRVYVLFDMSEMGYITKVLKESFR